MAMIPPRPKAPNQVLLENGKKTAEELSEISQAAANLAGFDMVVFWRTLMSGIKATDVREFCHQGEIIKGRKRPNWLAREKYLSLAADCYRGLRVPRQSEVEVSQPPVLLSDIPADKRAKILEASKRFAEELTRIENQEGDESEGPIDG